MKTDGIFQTWDEVNAYTNDKGELLQPKAQPGDVRFVDTNKDGVVDDTDRTKIGKGMPDWTFGLTLGADWKGFDLNLFFQGTFGYIRLRTTWRYPGNEPSDMDTRQMDG